MTASTETADIHHSNTRSEGATVATHSPHLRCDICQRKRPLSKMDGEPGLLLFCKNSLMCRIVQRRNERSR